MAWTVKRIEAENFMAFRRLDLDLASRHGVTLVEGTRGVPGKSNGASKSTLFEAIHWGLTGKTVRDLESSDKVMHRWRKPGESAVVRLTMDVDGREMVVERARSKSGPTVRVVGLDGRSNTAEGVQGVIDAALGLATSPLAYTTIFTGGMAQFCRLTDAQRKELLARMIGAEHFAKASKLAGERKAEADRRVAQLRSTVDGFDARLEAAYDERQREVMRHVRASLEQRTRERELENAVEVADEESEAAHAALSAYYVEEAGAHRARANERAKLETEAEAHDATADGAHKAAAELDKALAVSKAQIEALRADVVRLKADEHPPICPTCTQRWPAKTDRECMDAAVKAKQVEIDRLRVESGPKDVQRTRLRDREDEARAAQRKALRAVQALDAAGDASRERRLLGAALEGAASVKAALADLRRHRASMPEEGGFTADTTGHDERIEALRAQFVKAKDDLVDETTLARRLEFWRRGFGRQGLPSFLLDGSVPQMNETVAKVADALSDGELAVSFDPAAAKGNGEVFAVRVEYADGGDSYGSSSNGEHTRVDMAVLFAIRELVASRGTNRCTQLFLDEVLTGADAAFAEAFVGMLRDLYKGTDVFVISHDDAVKALCDQTITVRKTGRAAEIV